MPLDNVSDRLENFNDEIKNELGNLNGSAKETIKNMDKATLANILEKNYKDKEWADINKDHGWATVVQAALSYLGYDKYLGDVDGVYGTHTKEAVSIFQKKHGLVGTGRAGPKTIAKLVEGLKKNTTPETPLENNEGTVVEESVKTEEPIKTELKAETEEKIDTPVLTKVVITKPKETVQVENKLIKIIDKENLKNYRNDEKIPEGTFKGVNANLNGKGIGEAVNIIFSASYAASDGIASNMEVLYNYDNGKDENLYAIALWKAMDGFGTNNELVDKTIMIGNSYDLLGKIFNAFGVQKKNNLIQWIASEMGNDGDWRDEVQLYLIQFINAGAETKQAVKELVTSNKYSELTFGLREDEVFKKSLGVTYTPSGRKNTVV